MSSREMRRLMETVTAPDTTQTLNENIIDDAVDPKEHQKARAIARTIIKQVGEETASHVAIEIQKLTGSLMESGGPPDNWADEFQGKGYHPGIFKFFAAVARVLAPDQLVAFIRFARKDYRPDSPEEWISHLKSCGFSRGGMKAFLQVLLKFEIAEAYPSEAAIQEIRDTLELLDSHDAIRRATRAGRGAPAQPEGETVHERHQPGASHSDDHHREYLGKLAKTHTGKAVAASEEGRRKGKQGIRNQGPIPDKERKTRHGDKARHHEKVAAAADALKGKD